MILYVRWDESLRLGPARMICRCDTGVKTVEYVGLPSTSCQKGTVPFQKVTPAVFELPSILSRHFPPSGAKSQTVILLKLDPSKL